MQASTPGTSTPAQPGHQRSAVGTARLWNTLQQRVPIVKKAKQEDPKAELDEPCKKYNFNDGRRSYGASCHYLHKCSACGGAHPLTHCYRLQRGANRKNEAGSSNV